ncbi:MAG: Ditrans,polycis-undecaprenyl-diphosphate synthase ((2E,6E)-farnesyl-diphosphate specific) [Chlamydiae bacterium]|nr:Ditrans,polycis-undecaprenyl-diphosphate synthase ((2E,6E)-farnesyl-diphosphate specific) [Chlamydiota bacterium]
MDVNTILPPNRIYPEKNLLTLNRFCIPKHIAIIMDGNRRWAMLHGLLPMAGHFQGAETLLQIVRAASELGVEVLTVYAFSTENWKRTPEEVEALMKLFKTYIVKQENLMLEEGVRLDVIGDMSKLPHDVRKTLDDAIETTKGGERFNLVLALNYGGRDELKRAVSAIVEDCLSKKLSKEEITEELIASYLDTSRWKDPDLLIRTSGESRLSNFLLWQISYSEVYMTDVLWPDFSEKNLLEAILEYQKKNLRIGS